MTIVTAFPQPETPDSKPVLEWIRTEFHLPPDIAALCTHHFLRVWNGEYVASAVQEGLYSPTGEKLADSFPTKMDSWIVHWQSTPTVVRSAARVACSFREYRGVRYVVIKVWKGEQE